MKQPKPSELFEGPNSTLAQTYRAVTSSNNSNNSVMETNWKEDFEIFFNNLSEEDKLVVNEYLVGRFKDTILKSHLAEVLEEMRFKSGEDPRVGYFERLDVREKTAYNQALEDIKSKLGIK